MPNNNIVNPHFRVPFAFQGGSAICVEQDGVDDVAQCVAAVLLTPKGYRLEIPGFGIEDLALVENEVSLETIESVIETWEPRAVYTLTRVQVEDILSSVIQINVGVSNAQ